MSFWYDIYFEKWYYVSFSVKNIMYNIFLKIVVAAILDLWMNNIFKLKVVSEMTYSYKMHIEKWYFLTKSEKYMFSIMAVVAILDSCNTNITK